MKKRTSSIMRNARFSLGIEGHYWCILVLRRTVFATIVPCIRHFLTLLTVYRVHTTRFDSVYRALQARRGLEKKKYLGTVRNPVGRPRYYSYHSSLEPSVLPEWGPESVRGKVTRVDVPFGVRQLFPKANAKHKRYGPMVFDCCGASIISVLRLGREKATNSERFIQVPRFFVSRRSTCSAIPKQQ